MTAKKVDGLYFAAEKIAKSVRQAVAFGPKPEPVEKAPDPVKCPLCGAQAGQKG